jgi:hypothetical protein
MEKKEGLTFEDIRAVEERLLGIEVEEVHWFSTYHVHHRVAGHFKVGRCFVMGDAAHIHSPVGGQGMNTGIGDAVNAGWKIAAVLAGKAQPSLLDTYEPERIAFARALVATTDTTFRYIVNQKHGNLLIRMWILPHVVAFLTRFLFVRTLAFKALSQIKIQYRTSALSRGKSGRVHGGDRLPWVPMPEGDNFSALESLEWQAHIYGEADTRTAQELLALRVPLRVFPWSLAAKSAGLSRGALYLVRPDGYVAYASPVQNTAEVAHFVHAAGIVF